MNTLLSRRFALLTAAALFTHVTFAAGGPKPPPPPPPQPSSGALVLDLPNAFNWGLAAAPSGTIYAVGNTNTDWSDQRQLVLSSSDGGNSWSLLDDFAPPGRLVDFGFGVGGSVALDPFGNLYVTGRSLDNDLIQPERWYVRRSTNGGATWATVDDLVLATAFYSDDDTGIAVDAGGNVFVSGDNGYPSGSGYTPVWTVRKGADGTSFSIVDALPNCHAKDILVHPTAGIFVVGEAKITIKNQTSWAWLVRRSTDGGATWSNVDMFQLASSKSAVAMGIVANTSGLFVVGHAYIVNKGVTSTHWIVRKSTNGGNSWTTVDDYQLVADNSSQARCIATDANGNLVVAGRGEQGINDGTFRNRYWVVRKSMGGTSPWTTVDVFQNGGAGTTPNAIAADALADVFVGGNDGANWLIKKY